MKKDLITFIVLLALPLSAIAEKAVFIAKGYNYTRKADRKAFVADPTVGQEFTIDGVCSLTLLQAGGEKEPSVEGNRMICNLDNEILLTNAPGVKINTIKLRYASSTYGQHTQINWGSDDRNNEKQFSLNKGSGETGSNIRTQNYIDASVKVRMIAKGELHLNFIEVEYTVDPTSAVGEMEEDRKNLPVEYFNLKGIKVPADALVPGIYIRRQGGVSKKILVR
ncbi:MAG: hypothetical protein J6L79_01210 [Muribaculaceae bacterium]|nr:hypothetical protein [Muribaculaceae bacterium]